MEELIGKATAEKNGLMPKEQFWDSGNVSGRALNTLLVEGKHVLSVQRSYWEEAGIFFLPAGYGVVEVTKPYIGNYVKQSIIITNSSSSGKLWVADRFSSDNGKTWVSMLISGEPI